MAANNSRTGPPTVADDEVSSALLRQSLEDLRRAVDQLSGRVSDYNVLQHRVAEVEKDVEAMKERKTNDRRLILVAVVAPTTLWLFQLFVASKGLA